MARTTHFRYVLLILCLCAATLPGQEADLLPPLPPSSALPPPEPETLPPPPQLEWTPLAPKDEGGGGGVIETAIPPSPQDETPITPPPPVVETPVVDGVDPASVELAKPDVEVWRTESESPQMPARLPERLDEAYVAGPAPVWLRVQYNPLAAGKKVLVRAGRGITVYGAATALTIPSSGEILVQARLTEGVDRSHVNFYCDGIKTALPVVRASLDTVQQAETGGGQ